MKLFISAFLSFLLTISAFAQELKAPVAGCVPVYQKVLTEESTGMIIGDMTIMAGLSGMNWQLLAISEGEAGANGWVLFGSIVLGFIGWGIRALAEKHRNRVLNNTISIIEGSYLADSGYNQEFVELALAVEWQVAHEEKPILDVTHEEVAQAMTKLDGQLDLCPIKKIHMNKEPVYAVFKFKALRKLIAYHIRQNRNLTTTTETVN